MLPCRITPLNRQHNRNAFDCGNEKLNLYFRKQAGQDVRRGENSCFVLTHADNYSPMDFYTLSAHMIEAEILFKISHGKRQFIPVSLLGKLAIDKKFQASGYGRLLVSDALTRCLTNDMHAVGLFVEAKNEKALDFYIRWAFLPFLHYEHL